MLFFTTLSRMATTQQGCYEGKSFEVH